MMEGGGEPALKGFEVGKGKSDWRESPCRRGDKQSDIRLHE